MANRVKMTPIAPKQPQAMTPEQQAAAIARSLTQKAESVAQGVLYNLIGGYTHAGKDVDAEEVTSLALDIAARFIKKTPEVMDALFDEMFNKPVEENAPEAK